MSETKRCPKCQAEIPAGAPEGLCPSCLLQAGLQPKTAEAEPKTAAYSPSGSGFVPPTPAELQPSFPQLEILELLGKGGMGAVYKARQPGLDRLVAVKILPPEVSQDPAFAERFTREARALAMLNHPNIVGIYDSGRTSPSPPTPLPGGEGRSYYYFVMEYLDGVNLRQAMRAGELKSAEALKIVPQICEALQFAHDEGIVHRDIKPENILLDKKGRVKIADFGLAKLLGKTAPDVSLTGTQQVMGTMHYMAPEQLEGSRDVDHRADIYSLGVTFYEMLTGELPIGRFAAPSKKVQIDVRLDEVVLRSLEKEPEQRYQHASEIKTDVEAINLAPASSRQPLPSAGIERTNTAELNPISLLEATSGWKRWLPLVSLAAGVIGAFILMALSPNEGRDVCVGLSIFIGFMLLSMIQSLLLTIRWTVEYRGHQIAVEFQNASASRRLMIDGLTAASGTGASPASGGKVWDYELRATIPHGQGIGDEIICTVERSMILRCRIIALPKTPVAQAMEAKTPEQRYQHASEIKREVETIARGLAPPSGFLRTVVWTLICVVLFVTLWTPYEPYRRNWSGFLDHWVWPYRTTSYCSVALEPSEPTCKWMFFREESEETHNGKRDTPYYGHEGKLTYDIELHPVNGKAMHLELNARNDMYWTTEKSSGFHFDPTILAAWLREGDDLFDVAAPEETQKKRLAALAAQARAITDIIQNAAKNRVVMQTGMRMSPLEAATDPMVRSSSAFKYVPGSKLNAVENVKLEPTVPILYVGVPLMLAVWGVGMWLLLRRRRVPTVAA